MTVAHHHFGCYHSMVTTNYSVSLPRTGSLEMGSSLRDCWLLVLVSGILVGLLHASGM